jgi:CBS domain-containing protein
VNVKDMMVRTPASCTPETNLGAAAEMLWNRNCGILPIVDSQQRVIGVVTDRDLCIAMGTRNRLPGEITLAQVASGKVYSCRPEEAISVALETMAQKKVRRLIVVDSAGKLQGILSMDDIVLHAESQGPGRVPDVSPEAVIKTLKAIYGPQLPQLAQSAARAASGAN